MTMNTAFGRLLGASTLESLVGCRVTQANVPAFGTLARLPVDDTYQVYGLVYNIHIEEDGTVRQLAAAGDIRDEVVRDNRENRTVPIEFNLLHVGYEENGRISHLLPPRIPLSLEVIHACTPAEVVRFTGAGRLGYFRHILRAEQAPIPELFAAHLLQASRAHAQMGDPHWLQRAQQEIIILLRDDYAALMNVLNALADVAQTAP
ncbi:MULTISPECIES: hypothetical protein [Anaerolinea]|uniref:Helicase HerA barrel domain-containing protein n=1 Tax=Anaerolinea thermophila (strain DSM 14523 / JCM 11388 / NBRC 100420 / UNI-1) TaxID=926569 RepID=E8N2S2_ANATU|nr:MULTISPECIES: hypothetical protein [Anaerolinea]BAJ65072.1 hypothetical protein ANT_30460 [Anaerolinea thermophila UNI-1]